MIEYLMQLIYGSDFFGFLASFGVTDEYIPLIFIVLICVVSCLVLYIFICFFQLILNILNRKR